MKPVHAASPLAALSAHAALSTKGRNLMFNNQPTESGTDAKRPPSLCSSGKAIFAILRAASAAGTQAPTVREMGRAAGLSSSSSVQYQLAKLERMGFIKRYPNSTKRRQLVKILREVSS